MKIAVFGPTGQVGRALGRLDAPGKAILPIPRATADFAKPDTVRAAVADLPDDVTAVINAAAYTAVDKAESEPDLARTINAASVGAMAEAAASRGLPLVHISTDYVFPGTGEAPWAPGDATGPLGVYGATKLEGEQMVAAAGGPHAILRTSWVFSADGANFVKTMLRLAETRDTLRVVADQVGGPTPARDIAAACLQLAEGLVAVRPGGIHHLSGDPDVSWADFAREIFRQAGRAVHVEDIATAEYPTPARRPLNSRLNCDTLFAHHGIRRPDWRAGLARVLKEMKTS